MPHAKWLFGGATGDACTCKFCAGGPRLKIRSTSLSLHLVHDLAPRGFDEDVRSSPSQTQTLHSRDNNYIVPQSIGLQELRVHREGEIVWVVDGRALEDLKLLTSTEIWPGVIVDVRVELVPAEREQLWCSTVYGVQLLGTEYIIQVYDLDIIPCLGLSSGSLNLDTSKLEHPNNDGLSTSSVSSMIACSNISSAPHSWLTKTMALFLRAIQMCLSVAGSFGVDFPSSSAQQHAEMIGHEKRSFEGLWWGTERIWLTDLVRLKAERHLFPPEMQEHFTSPVPAKHSVGRHGVFLFVLSIYESEDNEVPAITGLLYETVGDGWDSISQLAITQTYDRDDQEVHEYPSQHLPPAPPRSIWRPLVEGNNKITLSANLIAGRYYPHVLSHPRCGIESSKVDQVLELPSPDIVLSSDDVATLSLAGLEKGWLSQTTATLHQSNRSKAFQAAASLANFEQTE